MKMKKKWTKFKSEISNIFWNPQISFMALKNSILTLGPQNLACKSEIGLLSTFFWIFWKASKFGVFAHCISIRICYFHIFDPLRAPEVRFCSNLCQNFYFFIFLRYTKISNLARKKFGIAPTLNTLDKGQFWHVLEISFRQISRRFCFSHIMWVA